MWFNSVVLVVNFPFKDVIWFCMYVCMYVSFFFPYELLHYFKKVRKWWNATVANNLPRGNTNYLILSFYMFCTQNFFLTLINCCSHRYFFYLKQIWSIKFRVNKTSQWNLVIMNRNFIITPFLGFTVYVICVNRLAYIYDCFLCYIIVFVKHKPPKVEHAWLLIMWVLNFKVFHR